MRSNLSMFVILALFLTGSTYLPSRISAQTDNRGMRVATRPQAERRVALVIGNSNYGDSPLLNPVKDARDMAQTLRGLGFEVMHGENLSQNDMKRNIRAFGDKIRNGGVGLFYYAGHGIQVSGTNYLVPIGATIANEEEVEYESVDVGLVLAQMENARNHLNIVILDACRNNPFARRFRSANKGLASIDAPSGTIIAYATAPGSVASDGTGRNGLYTQELLSAVQSPGLKIEEVFKRVRIIVQKKTAGKQTPWESSSLTGDFYFLEENIAPSGLPTGQIAPAPGKTESLPALDLRGFRIKLIYIKERESDVVTLAARLRGFGADTILSRTSGAGNGEHTGKIYYVKDTENIAKRIANSVSDIEVVKSEFQASKPDMEQQFNLWIVTKQRTNAR